MNTSTSPRGPSLSEVVALLVAIGIPAGVVGAFHDFILAHPVPSLVVGILYVVMAGTMLKTWQRLEDRWAERGAGWIDTRVQWFTSRARRQYCRHLVYQQRDFDVKGLNTQGIYTLDLEQVFVELRIDPTPAHATSSDPIRLPPALATGEHAIWDYLAAEGLKDQHLVVIGAPGSGKTSLLKHIALVLAARPRHPGAPLPRKLPFLLFLRESARLLQDTPEVSLVEVIEESLKRGRCAVPAGWVERQLKKGQALVLLDGLDEVADSDKRRQLAEWVQRQMQAYRNNRFLVTSRPFGYRSNPLGGVTVLEVQPFASAQIKRFIHNWYLANERMSFQRNDPGVQMKAEQGAEDLLRRLWNTPALFALAVNPLLLTMIATVHRYRSSLPGKRVELYEEICEVFLGKRQEARGIPQELNARQKQQVLQQLAYSMMARGERETSREEAYEIIHASLEAVSPTITPPLFLQMVEETSGLLLEREQNIYSFAHLTFQEYLAATHIKEAGLEQDLALVVGASWWHETIRLYCAQTDATAIIAACLAGERPTVPAHTLALECAQEAPKIQPAMRNYLDHLIQEGIEDPDPERRRLVAEVLLERRLRQMVPLNETTYRDTSLVTYAEYQLFHDEQQAQGVARRPDHWESSAFPPGTGSAPVLGVRPSDAVAFCQWLNERERGTWFYRLPQEREQTEADQAIAAPHSLGVGYWISNGEAFTWLRIPPDSVNDTIYKCLEHDRLCITCTTLVVLLEVACSRVQELYNILSHAFALSQDRNNVLARLYFSSLASVPARSLELDHDLTQVRDLAWSLDHDLANTLDHDFTRARALTRALGLKRALEGNNPSGQALFDYLNQASTVSKDLANTLTLANNLALVNAHTHDVVPSHVLDRDLNIDRASASVLARSLARASTYIRDSIRPLNIDRANTNNIANTGTLALGSILAQTLVKDSCYTFERDVISSTDGDAENRGRRQQASWHRFINRLSTLILYFLLAQQAGFIGNAKTWRSRLGTVRNQQEVEAIMEQASEDAYECYRALLLLKLRIEGKLPAWEGILLVKERRQQA